MPVSAAKAGKVLPIGSSAQIVEHNFNGAGCFRVRGWGLRLRGLRLRYLRATGDRAK